MGAKSPDFDVSKAFKTSKKSIFGHFRDLRTSKRVPPKISGPYDSHVRNSGSLWTSHDELGSHDIVSSKHLDVTGEVNAFGGEKESGRVIRSSDSLELQEESSERRVLLSTLAELRHDLRTRRMSALTIDVAVESFVVHEAGSLLELATLSTLVCCPGYG
jgi:hypothetical protein